MHPPGPQHRLPLLLFSAFLVSLALASVRHALLHSGAYDLGIFDQAVFLISRWQRPLSSFVGMHILGDHGAWILYVLAPLYWIKADVHWLFALQAGALVMGAWAVHQLANSSGVQPRLTRILVFAYLLQPILFNVNLFDFHPETLAVPALLWAVAFARSNHRWRFFLLVLAALGCKEVVALNVVAMGVWLVLFERRRFCGLLSISMGTAWFLLATLWLIPAFSGGPPAAMARYSYLGSTPLEALGTMVTHPTLIFERIFSLSSLKYGAYAVGSAPLVLLGRRWAAIIGALPTILLNVLADYGAQHSLRFQYLALAVPFLFLVAIANLKDPGRTGRKPVAAVVLIGLAFLAFGDYQRLWRSFPESLTYLHAADEGLALVPPMVGVLTTAELAPHLAHRPLVVMTDTTRPPETLEPFDAILLSLRRPGWRSSREFDEGLIRRALSKGEFQVRYREEGIILLLRNSRDRALSRPPSITLGRICSPHRFTRPPSAKSKAV